MLVEEYKKYFPNYRFSEFKPYHAKLLAFIKKTMACLPSQEEKQKYAELISKRSPKTWEEVASKVKQYLTKELFYNSNISRVLLIGSYAGGWWIDEDTEEETTEIIRRVRPKKKGFLSDIDILIWPWCNLQLPENSPVQIFLEIPPEEYNLPKLDITEFLIANGLDNDRSSNS